MMDNIRGAMMEAIDRAMTCEPDYLVMGMSSETFWDGLEGSRSSCKQRVEAHAGVKARDGSSDSSQAALKCYGARRLGVDVTPYMPVGDAQVRRFLADCGFEVVRLKGFCCPGPVAIQRM